MSLWFTSMAATALIAGAPPSTVGFLFDHRAFRHAIHGYAAAALAVAGS